MAARVSQAMSEALVQTALNGSARVSQVMVDAVVQTILGGSARVSQVMVEAVVSRRAAPPAGGSGRWFSDFWGEFEIGIDPEAMV